MNKQELKIIAHLLDELQTLSYKDVDRELTDEILYITNKMPELKKEIEANNVCLGDLAYIMEQKIKLFLKENNDQ